jgi:hypothetical protein
MKAILIVLKTLVITYWVLAATLFTSMLFFPSAIDTLYSGYTQFVEVIEVEEEPTCLALIPECGYYGEVETEEPVVEEESSEPVTEESEEPVVEEESSEPVTEESEEPVVNEEESSEEVVTESEESSEPVTTEEETTEPSETEEETSDESSEPETTSDGEAAEVEPSSEEPTTSEEETTEEEEEVVIDEETPVDPIPEEELTEPIIVDFIPLTEEEFVNVLETILIYSAVSMLPITLFVFSLGKKHRDLSSPTKPEIQKPAVVTDASGKVKKSAKVKYESIGLTGLKIKK